LEVGSALAVFPVQVAPFPVAWAGARVDDNGALIFIARQVHPDVSLGRFQVWRYSL
jgi:hypothetical protein